MSNKKEAKERKDTYQIVLIGTGGTGGLFAGTLARYIYSMGTDSTKSFSLSLVDADRVEEKNVSRQPFTKEDVGEFKVDCLAEAFSYMYGTKINPFPQYIDTVNDLEKIVSVNKPEKFTSGIYDCHNHLILIGGVDNHRARQVMEAYFMTWKPSNGLEDILYLDSANEFDYGTCIGGYRDKDGEKAPSRAFFYPAILKDKGKSASELSCGEINVSAPQHLLTNLTAANVLFSRVVKFVTDNSYMFGVTYFTPFDCEIIHRDEKFYNLKEDYHSLWVKNQEKAKEVAKKGVEG